jgi:PPOX class probable F420-dependent enzyme
MALTPAQAALFAGTNYAVATTLRPDGSPHSTVVWVELLDGVPSFNTTTVRVKRENLAHDPRVALLVVAGGDFYHWVSIDGNAELVSEGAEEQIDRLSRKYDDVAWQYRDGEERITVRIVPEHVTAYGIE